MTTTVLTNADGGTVTLETGEGADIRVTVTYTNGRETTVCTCQDNLSDLIDLYNRTGYTE